VDADPRRCASRHHANSLYENKTDVLVDICERQFVIILVLPERTRETRIVFS